MSREADIKAMLIEQLSISITSETLIPGGLADAFSLPALIKKIEEKLNVTLDSGAVKNVKSFGDLVALAEESVVTQQQEDDLDSEEFGLKTTDI